MSATSQRRRPRQPRMPIKVRRRQALDAALELIAERGYAEVTMEAIAREANFAKPVLYNAYPGLGPLLAALLEREQARALRALADAMPPLPEDGDPEVLLLTWLETLAHTIAADPQAWKLILTPPENTPEVVRKRVRAGRALALDQIRAVVKSILNGRAAAALEPDLSAEMVLAMAEHAAGLLIGDPVAYPPDRLVSYAQALLSALGGS